MNASNIKQGIPEKISLPTFSCDTDRIEKIGGHDLMNLVTKIAGRRFDTERDKRQGGLISLLACFQNKESGLLSST
jgi:hypothetical protein